MEKEIEEEISCPICFEILADPVVLSCGHSFCGSHTAVMTKDDSVTCPMCREVQNLAGKPLKKNVILAGLIEKLKETAAKAESAPSGEKATLIPGNVGTPHHVINKDWNCSKCAKMNFKNRTVCFSCNAPKPSDNGTKPTQEVKVELGDWNCGKCAKMNFKNRTVCFSCNAPKTQAIQPAETTSSTTSNYQQEAGDWMCGKCRKMNFKNRTACFSCNAPKQNIGVANPTDPNTQRDNNVAPGPFFGAPLQNAPNPARTAAARPVEQPKPNEKEANADWVCGCGKLNFKRRDTCYQCHKPKTNAAGVPPANNNALWVPNRRDDRDNRTRPDLGVRRRDDWDDHLDAYNWYQDSS